MVEEEKKEEQNVEETKPEEVKTPADKVEDPQEVDDVKGETTPVSAFANVDRVLNEDAVKKAEQESKKEGESEKPRLPKFFVKKDERVKLELDLLTDINGNIRSVSNKGLGIDFEKFQGLYHFDIWFEFSMPGFEELTNYRSRCQRFDRVANQMVVNNFRLRHYYLMFHLKDWNLTDVEGKKLELEFDDNGALSDKSSDMVYNTFPTLLDILLNLFEKEILVRW